MLFDFDHFNYLYENLAILNRIKQYVVGTNAFIRITDTYLCVLCIITYIYVYSYSSLFIRIYGYLKRKEMKETVKEKRECVS